MHVPALRDCLPSGDDSGARALYVSRKYPPSMVRGTSLRVLMTSEASMPSRMALFSVCGDIANGVFVEVLFELLKGELHKLPNAFRGDLVLQAELS